MFRINASSSHERVNSAFAPAPSYWMLVTKSVEQTLKSLAFFKGRRKVKLSAVETAVYWMFIC